MTKCKTKCEIAIEISQYYLNNLSTNQIVYTGNIGEKIAEVIIVKIKELDEKGVAEIKANDWGGASKSFFYPNEIEIMNEQERILSGCIKTLKENNSDSELNEQLNYISSMPAPR